MDGLDITVFGRPSICWKGQPVSFPFGKMEALLYYLAVKGQASREELAGLLWSDMDEAAAKKNLRNTLYMLRKLTADEVVLTPNRSVVKTNPDIVNITDRHIIGDKAAASTDKYSGDFLEGFFCREAGLFEEWAAAQREYFREDYIVRLTKQIIGLMKNKKYREAKHFLRCLTDIDHYNESAYRALMRIYEREGSFSKVFELYLKLERKMASELGISPDDKTKEIYERVQQRNVLEPANRHGIGEDYFFGRKAELKKLIGFVDAFGTGASARQLIVLHGEQGVGKSTLMKRFIETVPGKDVLVLRTYCYEPEMHYPYKAWSGIFGQVMRVLAETGKTIPAFWHQVIAYMFPSAIASHDWDRMDTTFTEHIMRPGIISEVLCGIMGRLAKSRKIVISIEDIHWMDMHGLAVLKEVLRLYGSQVMCVSTCRSEHLERLGRALDDLSESVGREWLEVERFNREEVIRFSALALPPDKLRPEIQQKLYEYTEGNALFLAECFKLIQQGQDVENLSPKLQSVLAARMNNFSANGRKVLEAASAFIREANYDTLTSVCGLDELALVEAIEEILQNKVMIELDSPKRGGLSYRFSHALVRDYVYSRMSSSRQKMLHHRIGVHLEQLMATDGRERELYSAVLYHFAKAGEKYKVLEYTIKVAERFSSPHYEMYPEINDYYRKGSESIVTERLQITNYLQQISELLASLHAETHNEEALSRYKAAYLEMQGRCHIWLGEHRKGLRVIHELLRLARSKEYSDYLIKGYQQVVFCGIQICKYRLVELFANKLLKAANERKLTEKMATALRFLGLAHAMRKDNVTSERYYRQSIALFRRLPDGQGRYAANIGAAYNYIGDIRRTQGNLPEALTYYEKAIALYNQHNICAGEALSIIYINAGYMAFELGDAEKARRYLTEALRIRKQFGKHVGYWCLRSHCTLNGIYALMSVREGKPAEGLRYLRRADHFLEKHLDGYTTGIVLRVKAEVRAIMDRDKRTEKVFADYLAFSAQDYYRRSKDIFRKLGDAYQLQALERISL